MPIKIPGASTNENPSAGERHFRAGTPPNTSKFMAYTALLVCAAVVVVSWLTLLDVRAALSATAQGAGTVANVLLAACGIACDSYHVSSRAGIAHDTAGKA